MNLLRRPVFYQAVNGNFLRNIGCSRQLVKKSQNVSALPAARPSITSNALLMNSISTAATSITSIDQRNYSTNSIKHKILKTLGLTDDSKNVVAARSYKLFEEAIRQIDFLEFQTRFQSPNTFNTWFLITELHIWMLCVRAMVDRQHGEVIRNTIIEAMWQDVTYRAKKLSPLRQTLIRTQIQELSGQFQYSMLAYDEGLMTNDMRLASALWERYFERNSDNYDQIELLVKYVRMNIQMLDKIGCEDLLKKRNLKWISLQTCEKTI